MSKLKNKLIFEAKRRIPFYLLAVFFIWPAVSIGVAIVSSLHIPYHPLSLGQAILLSLSGMAVMVPDILVIGFIGLFVNLTTFSLMASLGLVAQTRYRISLITEPVILFAATLLGASFYYPAVLSQSILLTLRILPVWMLSLTLFFIVIALSAALASPGHRASVVTVVLVFAVLVPVPTICRNKMTPTTPSVPPVVLLGIDSISQKDDLSHLESWTRSNGGMWYTKAVSPGLLTNAVWTSILLLKPVKEHGVFHTFQSSSDDSNSSLIKEAGKKGYCTVSVFPDQLTCWVGADYAFDLDRSGPVGWRQLATSIFSNASILLPLTKPFLPMLPFTTTPPNQAGTYTYCIERQFNEVFSQSSSKKATLVVGHSTYLHVPAYPKYMDLSWDECKRVMRSPAYRINDRSFDWQDTDRPDDPIPLHQWKLKRVQTALIEAVDRMGFLERGGRMILLSDHGDRIGISSRNFHEERYHNVMFATFNLPVRDASLPISTVDSGSILGLVEREPFDPVVEFTIGEPSEWRPLVDSAKLKWDGRVYLNDNLLSVIFRRLCTYRPYSQTSQFEPN